MGLPRRQPGLKAGCGHFQHWRDCQTFLIADQHLQSAMNDNLLVVGIATLAIAAICTYAYISYRLWRWSEKFALGARSMLRGALIAVPFTPSVYGHAGVLPAIVVLAVPEPYWKWRFGLIPPVLGWIAVTCIIWVSSRRRQINSR
jgi:hypothetical protein